MPRRRCGPMSTACWSRRSGAAFWLKKDEISEYDGSGGRGGTDRVGLACPGPECHSPPGFQPGFPVEVGNPCVLSAPSCSPGGKAKQLARTRSDSGRAPARDSMGKYGVEQVGG